MDELATLLMYIARCVIMAVGGATGIIKMVKGKSDENPKEFGEGLASIGIAGVLFSATFAIAALFK